MATFQRVFIDAGDGIEAALRDLRSAGKSCPALRRLGSVDYEASKPWLVLEDSYETQLSTSQLLSQLTGRRVLCLFIQTVVDAFSFGCFVKGEPRRRLVYGCDGPEERTWETVSGAPELWEATAIFRASEPIEEIVEDLDHLPAEVVRRTYERHEFTIGQDLPVVGFNARGLGDAIHDHYDLPRAYTDRSRIGPPWPLRLLPFSWRL